MKIQVREYIEFIKSFTESTNIMTKNFFIVVPYTPAVIGGVGSKGGIADITSRFGISSGSQKSGSGVTTSESNFDENRSQLEERTAVVEQGLVRSGIRVARLGTEEVIELFYKAFNPGETEKPLKIN
jgi:hypothetical protein